MSGDYEETDKKFVKQSDNLQHLGTLCSSP